MCVDGGGCAYKNGPSYKYLIQWMPWRKCMNLVWKEIKRDRAFLGLQPCILAGLLRRRKNGSQTNSWRAIMGNYHSLTRGPPPLLPDGQLFLLRWQHYPCYSTLCQQDQLVSSVRMAKIEKKEKRKWPESFSLSLFLSFPAGLEARCKHANDFIYLPFALTSNLCKTTAAAPPKLGRKPTWEGRRRRDQPAEILSNLLPTSFFCLIAIICRSRIFSLFSTSPSPYWAYLYVM